MDRHGNYMVAGSEILSSGGMSDGHTCAYGQAFVLESSLPLNNEAEAQVKLDVQNLLRFMEGLPKTS